MWNILNVWEYGHLCENLTFIVYLCEIWSMCENIAICVKIWLSLVIYVKYTQCVRIRPFVWKFNFHCIFMWNMINVWKYSHLCENLTSISHLCENMAIWCLDSVSEALGAVSEALCSISDEHYVKSGNCLVSDEEKMRRVLIRRVSHPKERETHSNYTCLASEATGDARYGGESPFT
jgi:hypothetical protein